MTPLHLSILQHYSCCGGDDYDQLEHIPVRLDYAYELAEKGYLYSPDTNDPNNRRFEITEYGQRKFYEIIKFFSGEKIGANNDREERRT